MPLRRRRRRHPVAVLLARARSALALGDNATAEAAWRKRSPSIRAMPRPCSIWATSSASAAITTVAIAHYRQALLRVPGHAGVLNNLGLAYEAQGQTDCRPKPAIARCSPPPPTTPTRWPTSPTSSSDAKTSPPPPQATARLFAIRREVPAARLGAPRAGAAPQRRHGGRRGQPARGRANRAGRCRRADQSRLGLRREAQLGRRRSRRCCGRWRSTRSTPMRCRCSRMRASSAAIGEALDALFGARSAANWRRRDARPALPGQSVSGTGDADVAACAVARRPAMGAGIRAAVTRAAADGDVPQPGERLRIGFVSSDFRDHPMVHLRSSSGSASTAAGSRPSPTACSRARTPARPARASRAPSIASPTSARESAAAIAQRIRDDRIAILFDLNGYTTHSREQLFALRPAPIQVNSIGFPGTLGADWYDYILVDRFAAPEAMQPFYTERLWHMPHAFYPSDTTRAPRGPAPVARRMRPAGEGLRVLLLQQGVQDPARCVRDLDATAARRAGQRAVAARKRPDAERQSAPRGRRRRRRSGAAGVRTPRSRREEHLARHAAADLFVDTFPYGAHTTTNDALLMGLPVSHLRRGNAGSAALPAASCMRSVCRSW